MTGSWGRERHNIFPEWKLIYTYWVVAQCYVPTHWCAWWICIRHHRNKLRQYRLCGHGTHLTVWSSPPYGILFPSENGYYFGKYEIGHLFSLNMCTVMLAGGSGWLLMRFQTRKWSDVVEQTAEEREYKNHMLQTSHFDGFHLYAIHTPGSTNEQSWGKKMLDLKLSRG
jgi:hypothetical protein